MKKFERNTPLALSSERDCCGVSILLGSAPDPFRTWLSVTGSMRKEIRCFALKQRPSDPLLQSTRARKHVYSLVYTSLYCYPGENDKTSPEGLLLRICKSRYR